jgi:N6-L-threonylcarbamoyladenine synthase
LDPGRVSDRWFQHPILAIETSCDETSAAVVVGTTIKSNVISSQIKLHEKWGGVVPEAAARAHVEAVLPIIQQALDEAGTPMPDIEAVAVTNRPGLVGALSVGVTAAKSIAYSRSIPLLGVHHLEGHLLSTFADDNEVPFSHLALIASGGHTELVIVRGLGEYEIVGHTIDDAAGEAFDKSARLFGLPYPGGRSMEEQADGGNPLRYPLPKGLAKDNLHFSFSGLKTAVLRLTQTEGEALSIRDAAASVQHAIVSVLTEKTVSAAETYRVKAITLVGGVAANVSLRKSLAAASSQIGLSFQAAPLKLCTDNAAMIGIAASHRLAKGERSAFDLETLPNADLP